MESVRTGMAFQMYFSNLRWASVVCPIRTTCPVWRTSELRTRAQNTWTVTSSDTILSAYGRVVWALRCPLSVGDKDAEKPCLVVFVTETVKLFLSVGSPWGGAFVECCDLLPWTNLNLNLNSSSLVRRYVLRLTAFLLRVRASGAQGLSDARCDWPWPLRFRP